MNNSCSNNNKKNINNGRVNIKGNNNLNQFALYDKIPINNNDTYYKNALNGTWNTNILSDAFFSKENIDILQNGIRAGVYKKSNNTVLIGRQNDNILKMIMRSIYLQNSKNLSTNITQQISDLNNLVFQYAIPQIYEESIGYLKYKKDVSTMYTPIERPSATYSNNSLELKPWF